MTPPPEGHKKGGGAPIHTYNIRLWCPPGRRREGGGLLIHTYRDGKEEEDPHPHPGKGEEEGGGCVSVWFVWGAPPKGVRRGGVWLYGGTQGS